MPYFLKTGFIMFSVSSVIAYINGDCTLKCAYGLSISEHLKDILKQDHLWYLIICYDYFQQCVCVCVCLWKLYYRQTHQTSNNTVFLFAAVQVIPEFNVKSSRKITSVKCLRMGMRILRLDKWQKHILTEMINYISWM